MKKQCFIVGAIALFSFGVLQAQEKTVELDEITIDSRFKLKKENSGKVVHKITQKVIEQNKGKTIVDLINRVAGVEINGNSGVYGQNLSFFVRGGRSNEVVILIDGLQIVNPLQNNFDLRFLNLNQVESIEISKGASSTLYGAGAATAVINIRLKKSKEGLFNGNVSVTGGTNKTAELDNDGYVIQSNLGINGRKNGFEYIVSFSSFESDGISAAEDETTDRSFGDDPFRRNNFDIRLGYDLSSQFTINGGFYTSTFNNSFDAGSFADGNNRTTETNYRVNLSPEFIYNKGSVKLNIAYSNFDTDRLNTTFPGTSNGSNLMLDAFVKHNFGKLKLIAGINHQSNEIEVFSIPFMQTDLQAVQFSSEPRTTITDPYVNIVYISDSGFNINAGSRLNNHNIYGGNLVYNVNPSYRYSYDDGYLRLFTSLSTAFVTPSIRELFDPNFGGNPELEPQESKTVEFGFEVKQKSFTLNALYFNRDIDNIILFDSAAFKLFNAGENNVNGIEVASSFDILSNVSFQGNYTFTNNDAASIRIPKHKINANLLYSLSDQTSLSLDYQYVSDRDDSDFRDFFNVVPVVLDAYSTFDFSATHKINKSINVLAGITNIFNSDFQEVFGFSTRGRNFHLGINYNF